MTVFYLRLRDELGSVYADDQFKPLYPERGQPGLPPWRGALPGVNGRPLICRTSLIAAVPAP
jgi:hypothetical protein